MQWDSRRNYAGMAGIVVGYIYRFRWFVYAPVVVGAVLLGYLFNFLRLCLLVVYYKLALPYPWMQHHAKTADFIIGGVLFCCALAIFFAVANKFRRDLDLVDAKAEPQARPARPLLREPRTPRAALPYLAKVAAVLVLAAVLGFDAVRTHVARADAPGRAPVLAPMPQQIGAFQLIRTWNDTLLGGTIVYTWGDYAVPSEPTGLHVALGISPVLGQHDADVCHIARGEDATWRGQIETGSKSGQIALTAATYNNGVTQKLEASTVCDAGVCRQYSQSSQHITLVYSHPHSLVPGQGEVTRPVPVLLKVESLDTMSPVQTIEPQLAARLTQFLAGADLVGLTEPYSRR
jgi:exosortase J